MGPMHAHAQASLPRRLESHKLLVRKAFLVHSLGAHVNVRARMRVCALCAVRERAVRCACVHVLARVRTRARSLSHADCCGTPARALCVSVLYAVRIVRCACPHACAQLVARGLLWHTHTHSHTGTHTHTHTHTHRHTHALTHSCTRAHPQVPSGAHGAGPRVGIPDHGDQRLQAAAAHHPGLSARQRRGRQTGVLRTGRMKASMACPWVLWYVTSVPPSL